LWCWPAGLPLSGRRADVTLCGGEQLEIVKRHVEQHMADPDLTAASTAATVGISLRQLYVLFEPTGTGFARYVLRQRLLKCRDTRSRSAAQATTFA
jgi:transcriptional regulator GlxA family with amidase domain